ncbi:class II SORL domain-containing protein [Desulfovibrio oxyclinae]|jgi:superoxide reductase|uniref:class II SORL domain-containing protein n=1 Tax=Desulfovibrio oxyclinae TaxID=63560 RepID=UPI00036C6B84|nr:class II SORL domain-containing protein [Desulfovibrio oxyclinae]
MAHLSDLIKRDDWKNEKHVPVIEAPDSVSASEPFDVKVSIGKEVAHPNTTEHHIRWIRLFFKPQGQELVYEAGAFEFNAHGESAKGANEGPVYTHHGATCTLKISEPGHLIALGYCNIHGLWENSREIALKG